MPKSLSKSLRKGVCLLSIAAFFHACGEHDEPADPFDEVAIKKDFKERPLNVIHDEFEGASWTPPVPGLITEAQILSFVQMNRLAMRIVEVSSRDFDEKVEKASHDEDRYSRAATEFSAAGNVRNAATAQIRASLRLGLNPREMDWLGLEISRAARILAERRVDEKQGQIPQQRTPAEKANTELVARHAKELAPYIRALRTR